MVKSPEMPSPFYPSVLAETHLGDSRGALISRRANECVIRLLGQATHLEPLLVGGACCDLRGYLIPPLGAGFC